MEARQFAKMLSDKDFLSLKKLQYKYSAEDVTEMLSLLKSTMAKTLPIQDFNGKSLVYLESVTQINLHSVVRLLVVQRSAAKFGIKAMEEEIHSTFRIENIKSSRDSIRKILNGYAPSNDSEQRIYGMKRGLEFIGDRTNKITEENLHTLYLLTISEALLPEDQLLPQNRYRHDAVYIVGSRVEHEGLPAHKLPDYMNRLIAFINQSDKMNDLLKAATIHFYFAYLHPYFDGNGRMARLLHLWYLVQQGYPSALFIPFSKYVSDSRTAYYDAYTQVEANAAISGMLDITPFLVYFIRTVYDKLEEWPSETTTLKTFDCALENGQITEKEKDLWYFVLSAYGDGEFSTKQIEKDFGNAAYATIRSFVLKFAEMGLLSVNRYGNRCKYKING